MALHPAQLAALSRLGAVGGLGLTQIIGYGTLYYSFGPLAEEIAADLGWGRDWIFGVFSLSLVALGLVAPLAGRLIDRHGAGRMMTLGTLVGALALATMATAPWPVVFVLGVVAMQVASAFALYDAAFACLVQLYGTAAPRRIAELTLIGGFASTIFWPITGTLSSELDWRSIFLLYAGLHLLLCLPIHFWLARHLPAVKPGAGGSGAAPGSASAPERTADGSLPPALRRHALVLVTLAFTLSGFVLSALLMHMVPLLTALGFGAAAIGFGALFGPAQVAVRLLQMGLGNRLSPMAAALFASALLAGAVLLLTLTAPSALGGIVFALCFGFGSGLTSIVRGTLPLALFGRAGFGQRLGRITGVRHIVTAVAPYAFAFLMERFGLELALFAVIVVGSAAVIVFLLLARLAAAGTAATARELRS